MHGRVRVGASSSYLLPSEFTFQSLLFSLIINGHNITPYSHNRHIPIGERDWRFGERFLGPRQPPPPVYCTYCGTAKVGQAAIRQERRMGESRAKTLGITRLCFFFLLYCVHCTMYTLGSSGNDEGSK